MEIVVTDKSHIDVIQTLATIANKSSIVKDDKIIILDSNREHSSNITKKEINHKEPIDMRCIGVPGKAFFVKSDGRISVTGNTMHVEGMSKIFKTICEENKKIVTDKFKKEIYEMARVIIDLEDTFIDLVYQDYDIEGLSKEEVKKYIRFIANRRLLQLGLKENWLIEENPLPWLEWILNASNHTNFFENKVSEYQISGLVGEVDWNKNMKYKIVSRDGCPYCEKAVEVFINNGFDFEEIKINDLVERNKFYDSINLEGSKRSVPQIWKIEEDNYETYIGGYTELRKSLRT